MAQVLRVELGARSYPIHFRSEKDLLLAAVAEMQRQGRPAALLTDAGVTQAQGE